MKKFRNIFTRKTKKILAVVGIVLATVMLCAVLGNATSGFSNLFKPDEWSIRTVNEDNLYQSFTFAGEDGVINDGVNGVTVELDKHNAIKVKGTSEAEQAIIIASGTLKANTSYIFDSSLNDGSAKTISMSVVTEDGEVLATSYKGVVKIPAQATDVNVEIRLNVADEHKITFTKTLKPVLCIGEDSKDLVDYYA